jgi:F-type H+-transporting ATPase subunit b
MVYVDFTLVIQIVQFLIILFVSKKMILDPIMKTMETRNAKIEGLTGEAERLKKEVEDSKVAYNEKMNDMRLELAEYHRKIREEASRAANTKIEAAKAEVDARVKVALDKLEQEKQEADKQLDAIVGELSDLIVQKILKSA